MRVSPLIIIRLSLVLITISILTFVVPVRAASSSIQFPFATKADISVKEIAERNKKSKNYSNRFCNAIGFGLSKESALRWTIKENALEGTLTSKEDEDALINQISFEIIEKCGTPLNLEGRDGALALKKDFLKVQAGAKGNIWLKTQDILPGNWEHEIKEAEPHHPAKVRLISLSFYWHE